MTTRRAMKGPEGGLLVISYDRFTDSEKLSAYSNAQINEASIASDTCCRQGDHWGYRRLPENCACLSCEIETLRRRVEDGGGVWSAANG
jgi:hypothetical protein